MHHYSTITFGNNPITLEASKSYFGFVYIITRVSDGKRYVGMRTFDKRGKWKTYCSSSKPMKADIEKLGHEAFKFSAVYYAENIDHLSDMEQQIAEAMDWKHAVLPSGERAFYNLHFGGVYVHCGEKHSEETKRKISEALTGKTLTEETRRKMSKANKGKTLTEETRRKLSEVGKGRTFTEITRKKISEANKRRTQSEETRQKISEAQKGKTLTEEHRRKLSEAQKGRIAPNIGKPHSDETKRKMSEAAKKRLALKHAK